MAPCLAAPFPSREGDVLCVGAGTHVTARGMGRGREARRKGGAEACSLLGVGVLGHCSPQETKADTQLDVNLRFRVGGTEDLRQQNVELTSGQRRP